MTFDFGDEEIRSIGAYLRKVREEKEMTLEEAATQTKIHLHYLRALEEDEESEFPSGAYRSLFTKSYAEFLGISLEEVFLRLPEAELKASTEGEKRTTAKSQQSSATAAKGVASDQLAVVASYLTRYQKPILVAGAVLLVAIVLIIFLPSPESEDMAVPSPADTPTVALMDQDMAPAEIADSLYLLLVGRGRCWLDVRIDGDSVHTAILADQDTIRFSLADSVYFKLGRANGASGWLNGLPLRLGGAADSTPASFFLTRENYRRQIDSSRLVE
ncbi:MAG: DUF4115 domain-containing protein [candidate division Zixibacteria bacterium]|nr:DUF4115 domain-containing protein [candidate division Zixibacteria bacterium]